MLIPLDKNPGMRPIGIGERIQGIIEQAVTSCLRSEIINTNGNLQLCIGIRSESETAVHTSFNMLENEENHGILQTGALNTFNSVNKAAILHTMNILFPIYIYIYIYI